jgi:hypothetical protein
MPSPVPRVIFLHPFVSTIILMIKCSIFDQEVIWYSVLLDDHEVQETSTSVAVIYSCRLNLHWLTYSEINFIDGQQYEKSRRKCVELMENLSSLLPTASKKVSVASGFSGAITNSHASKSLPGTYETGDSTGTGITMSRHGAADIAPRPYVRGISLGTRGLNGTCLCPNMKFIRI